MTCRDWRSRFRRPGVLFALVFLLGPPSARSAAPARVPKTLLTFYFGAFHVQEYGPMPPITPDNIKRKYPPVPVTDPAVAHKLSDWLAARGGEAQFSPLMTRLRVDFADGRPPVFVDDYGVVRAGASEYALPRAAFEHISVTLGRISKAHSDAITAARERARPAFIRAADTDDQTTVRRLLARGADINVRDNFHPGATALMLAAYNGNDALCRLLLEQGADINAQNKHGMTAVAYAVHTGCASTARLLLARGESAKGRGGGYALTDAVFGKDAAVVGLLLDRGAPINTRDELKKTPLMNAVDQRFKAAARLLIARGADVNVVDIYGSTPLESAAENGDDELVALLLDRGAQIDADPHRNGMTPLMAAVGGGSAAVVQLLLARAARFSVDGDGGRLLLKRAEEAGNPAITQMLVRAGAKKNE